MARTKKRTIAVTKRNAPRFWSEVLFFMICLLFKPIYYRVPRERINPVSVFGPKIIFRAQVGGKVENYQGESSFFIEKHSIFTPFRSSTTDSTSTKPIFSKRGLDILLASVVKAFAPADTAASSRRL